jgi:hypothetical protein
VSQVTARRETALEDASWGELIDKVLLETTVGTGLLIHRIGVDFSTPSSASFPALEVTIDDTPRNRTLLAAALYVDVDELEWVAPSSVT